METPIGSIYPIITNLVADTFKIFETFRSYRTTNNATDNIPEPSIQSSCNCNKCLNFNDSDTDDSSSYNSELYLDMSAVD